MDRIAAMMILLGVLVSLVLIILALFATAPVICSCILSLVYTLYLFMANEESGVHHAQEYENRFWTIFALLFSTALFFAQDSPMAFGRENPSLGFMGVLLSSYAMHLWDRYVHRIALSRQTLLRRSISSMNNTQGQSHHVTAKDQVKIIHECLRDIDQLLIPSTINNFINQRFVFQKEKQIISIFAECDAVALNYLVCHVKLGLIIYKIKDHRNFAGQHRTQLIDLLAVDRLPALTVMSRVIVLHALQILKLRANPRAEYWVRNIFLSTHGDDLSEIKSLTDAKGDYFSMNKLVFDDIKSETVRQDILAHIRREGALQVSHMQLGTRRGQRRQHMAWRKILSDVDDTLLSSGGSYPAGVDRRYAKKVVYPGVLAFYRELDLGTTGPEEWPDNRVGNLVFLSARPHVYKDMSEKSSFKKFEKLRMTGGDGRKGMHTVPSMLPGDITSGSQYMVTNDFEPLAKKKFLNFKQYVSIYPEYRHVFVCDNGQGDVRAGELMFDNFPYEFEGLYVHVVQKKSQTYGYAPQRWKDKELFPCFFTTYPEAALHAASRDPPLIRVSGLRRVCDDAVKDFYSISSKQWQSKKQKAERREELNQAIWRANEFLKEHDVEPVELIQASRVWKDGDRVTTPYGRGIILSFEPEFNMYEVALDWRPLDVQVEEHLQKVKDEAIRPRVEKRTSAAAAPLETVVEADEASDDENETTTSQRTEPTLKEEATDQEVDDTAKANIGGAEVRGTVSTASASVQTDASSITSVGSDNSHPEVKPKANKFKVTAKVEGKFISKYMPPHLPVVDKKPSSLVSFWSGSGTAPPPKPTPKAIFVEGDRCSTPYGLATVVEHRSAEQIVVVEMVGWKATAFLNESIVKVVKESYLSSLFRRPEASKPLEFPHAHGTPIQTPYGNATVTRPLPVKPKRDNAKVEPNISNATIGLDLSNWTLADGSHPKLYCTVKTASTWKETRVAKSQDGILSAFGTLVTSTFTRFSSGGTSGTTNKPKEEEPVVAKFERYYQDSASVSTSFGVGRVLAFRETDGFYKLSLTAWKLADGSSAVAWMRGVDIKYAIAKGCQEGYPVLTNLGLSGTLESVQPTTGVHIVTIPSAGMVMYLQPECIVRPLKAAVGEEALTPYGEGTIEKYNLKTDMYTIKLKGWHAKLYATAETFDRVRDSMKDKGGAFGMNWLLGFFFSSEETKSEAASTRSRSNSVVSGSGRSVSSLSRT
eukprot:Nitzschia sp. Nitz4//scaffold102_size76354//28389//32188//NITZ4_005631-RA/size76354-snap-gene-0.136-mRNA-1//-1//CDS//3329532246//7610//frame0